MFSLKGRLGMKAACTFVLGMALALAFALTGYAQDQGKEVTLKGTITCAKCDLKLADKCYTVVKVDDNGKDVVYWFDKASAKKYHGKICTSPTKGTVKGTVTEEDGKKTVNVTDVQFGE
jgi:hypothetical protein